MISSDVLLVAALIECSESSDDGDITLFELSMALIINEYKYSTSAIYSDLMNILAHYGKAVLGLNN